MSATLLEGKVFTEKIKEELRNELRRITSSITLTSIQIGEDPASCVYVNSQKKIAQSLGINYELLKLDSNIEESCLLDLIDKKNKDSSIQGLIIQMPIPSHLNRYRIIEKINPLKDIEGVHPVNLGKVLLGKPEFIPCTAQAVLEMVKSTGVNLYGREVVIIGHSEIVGKPLSLLFLNEFSTVTICHIGTFQSRHLEEHTRSAEILVVAVGKANLIKGEWIKEGAIVIDVGINRIGDKIVGDIEFEEAKNRASWITPVPGGVGPLTAVMLMRNLVKAAKLQFQK